MLSTRRLTAIAAAVLVLGIGTIAVAQERPAAGGPDKITDMLLRPAGWSVYWRGCNPPPESGESEAIFEAQGGNVLVKLAVPPDTRCSSEVAVTSSGYTFRGCRDPGITIAFDPNDPVYPFKGKSVNCSEYKFKAK
jgi:hypothetical protein